MENSMKKSHSDRLFDAINLGILVLICVIMVYPLYFIIIASLSDPYAVSAGQVFFWPKGISLDAYGNVFKNRSIWTGYRNTILYTFAGTLYNLALTIPAAYVLSKKRLPGHNGLSWFFFITMYFSGGMVPSYILMNKLQLLNTPWALIIGTGVSCYNLIVTRQFFSSSIPESLYEAASIDGASEFTYFFRIAIPLSMPIIAVMALFYGVGRWNDYYTALLYVKNRSLWPLQLILRNILIMNENAMADATGISDEAMEEAMRQALMAEAMKYSLIFIASAPLLIAYPFVQKYFVKGVMIGSVKG